MLTGKFSHVSRGLHGQTQIADIDLAAQLPVPALDESAEDLRLAKNLYTKILCQVLCGIQVILPPLLVIADVAKRAHADQDHSQTKPDQELGALEIFQYFALDDSFQHQHPDS